MKVHRRLIWSLVEQLRKSPKFSKVKTRTVEHKSVFHETDIIFFEANHKPFVLRVFTDRMVKPSQTLILSANDDNTNIKSHYPMGYINWWNSDEFTLRALYEATQNYSPGIRQKDLIN